MSVSTRLFLSVSEHYRTAVLPSTPPKWRDLLPILPYTTNELRTALNTKQQQDEQAVLAQLARLGSVSSWIVTCLGLTRDTVQEALRLLRDELKAQCNLLDILSAQRYKTLAQDGMPATRCPLQACQEKDSFDHMLRCYDLERYVGRGAATAAFLARMARKTEIVNPHHIRRFPDVEE